MSDDNAKRFNLSEAQPRKPFTLSADRGPPIKTKDNAAHTIPPPRTIFLPQPHLAPPGMAGFKLTTYAKDVSAKEREEQADRAAANKFKPLDLKLNKGRTFER